LSLTPPGFGQSTERVVAQRVRHAFEETRDSRLALVFPRQVYNKPGELEGVRNDSGIVFTGKRPYVISVMTTFLKRERDGGEAIIKISNAAHQMFDRLSRASEYGRVISPHYTGNP
jgi:hypothetical protein